MELRNVLVDELLLQGDRVRADDHALIRALDLLDRGYEVGEGLAHAGAGFNNQMVRAVQRVGHRVGHFQLLGAVLIAGHAAGQQPAGRQNVGEALGFEVAIRFRGHSCRRFEGCSALGQSS